MKQLGMIGVCGLLATACGAIADEPSQQDDSAQDTAGRSEPETPLDDGCGGIPSQVKTSSGGTIAISGNGSALRLSALYRGNAIGIEDARAVDMILAPSVGPFEAGKNSGYWAELQDAQGAVLYTDYFFDPLVVEAHFVGGGGSVSERPFCDQKSISIDVPMNKKATRIVVFGNGYKASVAKELARFNLPR